MEASREPAGGPLLALSATMTAMLALTAPKMVEVERSESQTAVLNSEIRGRIESQQLSSGASIKPAMRPESELDALIKHKVAGKR